ncbi:hypothetical protein BDW62DRAFT_197633 [Aspergillus aurantiobrunneus]
MESNGLYANEWMEDFFGEALMESPQAYRPGLHHPVHLDDLLGAHKKYKVIHKLGVGESSIVWLCRVCDANPARYVGVKILAASVSNNELQMNQCFLEAVEYDPSISEYCALPLDQFHVDGPNGSHQCFVFAQLGLELRISTRYDDPD